jgi:hypothetical protein
VTSNAWKTGHRGAGCGACEGAFEPGTIVVSALFEAPVVDAGDDDGPPFSRVDFCAPSFDGEADTGGPFSWWRFVVPPPEEKKATFDLSVAREFLQRLLDQGDPERASLRYLLTLLLMRKRIVKVAEHFTDKRGEVMAIRFPPADAIFEVVCCELSEDETDSLREQLGELFDLG